MTEKASVASLQTPDGGRVVATGSWPDGTPAPLDADGAQVEIVEYGPDGTERGRTYGISRAVGSST